MEASMVAEQARAVVQTVGTAIAGGIVLGLVWAVASCASWRRARREVFGAMPAIVRETLREKDGRIAALESELASIRPELGVLRAWRRGFSAWNATGPDVVDPPKGRRA